MRTKSEKRPSGLLVVAEENRVLLVKQLYDDWHGWYMLKRLLLGKWVDVRVLSRSEAMGYRTAKDEALEHKHIRRRQK